MMLAVRAPQSQPALVAFIAAWALVVASTAAVAVSPSRIRASRPRGPRIPSTSRRPQIEAALPMMLIEQAITIIGSSSSGIAPKHTDGALYGMALEYVWRATFCVLQR
jgi:hypothetical protein